jgi:hypothetical protein
MRPIIVSAAFVVALSVSAPAAAQYGGSPDAQVDGDYEPAGGAFTDDQAYADEDGKPAYGEVGPDQAYVGKDEWAGDADLAEPYPDDDFAGQDHAGQAYDDSRYAAHNDPVQDPPVGHEGETWQGRDGRSYCRRSDGTTGLIVGAGAGALVGRGFDTRGDRGAGTILGAIFGALLGSAVERSASCQ